jgi:hypothetical protein
MRVHAHLHRVRTDCDRPPQDEALLGVQRLHERLRPPLCAQILHACLTRRGFLLWWPATPYVASLCAGAFLHRCVGSRNYGRFLVLVGGYVVNAALLAVWLVRVALPATQPWAWWWRGAAWLHAGAAALFASLVGVLLVLHAYLVLTRQTTYELIVRVRRRREAAEGFRATLRANVAPAPADNDGAALSSSPKHSPPKLRRSSSSRSTNSFAHLGGAVLLPGEGGSL